MTFVCLLPLLGVGILRAEDVQFRAQAPAQVIVGRPFQFSYTVNQRAKDLRAPEFTDFDYIAGPYTSQSSSTSFVNGKRTSSFQMTFTYTLMAQKEGTFSIPPATITVSGERYTSNGVKITVLPEDQPQQSNSNSGQTAQRSNSGSGQTSQSGPEQGNIFVRTLVSKTKVYEQEAILLSYKVYVAGVDLKQFTNNTTLPDFTSFLQQKIDLQDVQLELENYNGRNYQTATAARTQSGTLTQYLRRFLQFLHNSHTYLACTGHNDSCYAAAGRQTGFVRWRRRQVQYGRQTFFYRSEDQ